MPVFDITSGIKATHRSGATPKDAYDINKKIVVQFAKRGYAVKWTNESPPSTLRAHLTDKDGTDLSADIDIVDEGTTTRCDINIHGHVFLGGLLGRLVSASTIQGRASEKIKEMLDENFAGQPSKRAPLAAAAPKPAPKPTGPSTLPPGHPGAAKAAPPPVVAATPSVAQASAPAPAPVAPKPQPAPTPVASSAAPAATSWQSLVDSALAGNAVDARTLITRAAAAGAAIGSGVVDATLLQPVQIALVQALAKQKGKKLDRGAASQVLARLGAAAPAQQLLAGDAAHSNGANGAAWLRPTAAAYALTVAVGEIASKALDSDVAADAPVDPALHDLFESTYERVLGEKVAAHGDGSALGDKLAQLKEAWDADLLSEAEMLSLRERVLASL